MAAILVLMILGAMVLVASVIAVVLAEVPRRTR